MIAAQAAENHADEWFLILVPSDELFFNSVNLPLHVDFDVGNISYWIFVVKNIKWVDWENIIYVRRNNIKN